MLRWTKWVAPMAALVLMAGYHSTIARADDATTMPDGKATVTVTVVDADGKPVEGAAVSILVAPPKHLKHASTEPDSTPAVKPTKPEPIETGSTGTDGTFQLTKIPNGSYVVTAKLKGTGTGRKPVTIADDKDDAVTLTLKAKKPK